VPGIEHRTQDLDMPGNLFTTKPHPQVPPNLFQDTYLKFKMKIESICFLKYTLKQKLMYIIILVRKIPFTVMPGGQSLML
jgi:hypothetical protein